MDALSNIAVLLGVAVITGCLAKGFLSVSRGYPGGFSIITTGVVAGGSLIALPALFPWLVKRLVDVSNGNLDGLVGGDDTAGSEPKDEPKADPTPAAPEPDEDTTSDIDLSGLADAAPYVLGGLGILIALALVAGVFNAIATSRKAAREAATIAAAEQEARLDRVWAEALVRHDLLRDESVRHETDIDVVLSMPLINDVSEPKTAAFIEALAKATDLSHETRPSTAMAVEAYAEATRAAERAWGVAWRNADLVRLSKFAPEERSRIKTVASLLKRAENETTPEARSAYYQRAMKTLGNLIAIPAPAAEAIESKVAGILANPNTADVPILFDQPTTGLIARSKARAAASARRMAGSISQGV